MKILPFPIRAWAWARFRSSSNACSHSAMPCAARLVNISTTPNHIWPPAWSGTKDKVLSDRVDREPDVSGVRQKRRHRHLADFERKLKLVSGLRPRRQPQDKRGENEVDDRDDCGGPDEPVGRLQPIEACDIRHAQPEHSDQRGEDEKPEPPRNDVEPDAPDERIRFPQDLQVPHEIIHHGPSPYRRPSILPMIMPTTMPPIAIATGCAPISFSLSSRNLAASFMSSPISSRSFSMFAAASGAATAAGPVAASFWSSARGSAVAGDDESLGLCAHRAVESSFLSDCNSSSIADLEAIGVSRACYCGVWAPDVHQEPRAAVTSEANA